MIGIFKPKAHIARLADDKIDNEYKNFAGKFFLVFLLVTLVII